MSWVGGGGAGEPVGGGAEGVGNCSQGLTMLSH